MTVEALRYSVPPPASDRAARWCSAGGHRSRPAVGVVIERDERGRARYARPACEGCVSAVEALPLVPAVPPVPCRTRRAQQTRV